MGNENTCPFKDEKIAGFIKNNYQKREAEVDDRIGRIELWDPISPHAGILMIREKVLPGKIACQKYRSMLEQRLLIKSPHLIGYRLSN